MYLLNISYIAFSEVEGCPSEFTISWEEHEKQFCAPHEPGIQTNYTQTECEDLCLEDPMCSAYDYSVEFSECMTTSGNSFFILQIQLHTNYFCT